MLSLSVEKGPPINTPDLPDPPSTGYEGLSSRFVPADELRGFLRDCFAVTDAELFVGHADRLDADLGDVPDEARFAAFCTYEEVVGDFAMRFDVGIEGRLAARAGRLEFARRFAARFDAYLLFGDDEPEPWLWTVVLPNGGWLFATMTDDAGRPRLARSSGPIPRLPQVPVDPRLGPPTYGRWSPADRAPTYGRWSPADRVQSP